jgi:hypothetical protein
LHQDTADADFSGSQGQVVESIEVPTSPAPASPVTSTTTTTTSSPSPVATTTPEASAPTSTTKKQTPAQLLRLSRASVSKSGRIELPVRCSVAGVVKYVARVVGSSDRKAYASGSHTSTGARAVTLVLHPTSTARSARAHHRRLSIRIVVTFVPSGQRTRATSTTVVTI